jgi:hypothetical protein
MKKQPSYAARALDNHLEICRRNSDQPWRQFDAQRCYAPRMIQRRTMTKVRRNVSEVETSQTSRPNAIE